MEEQVAEKGFNALIINDCPVSRRAFKKEFIQTDGHSGQINRMF
jgi:hypothetical protein